MISGLWSDRLILSLYSYFNCSLVGRGYVESPSTALLTVTWFWFKAHVLFIFIFVVLLLVFSFIIRKNNCP